MLKYIALTLICLVAVSRPAHAAGLNGDYTSRNPDGEIHLSLKESDTQLLAGEMFDGVSRFQLIGRRDGDTASGRINTSSPSGLGFSAKISESDDRLVLQIYPLDASGNPAWNMAEELVFSRVGAARTGNAGTTGNAAAISNVYINRQALTQQQVAEFEQQYRTQLIDGRYWYDATCGAWGLEGGPTIGFIIASLPLPRPLPEDISGGGTGIYINRRELHPADRQALIGMFGTAIPGRYWLDDYGNLGVEGGGVLVNLAVAAQQAGQQTTQTGSGTVSTGSSGAMFSGTNLSTGKPTFWYSGM